MKHPNLMLAVFFTAMFAIAYTINANLKPEQYHVYRYTDIDSLIKVGVAKPLGTPELHF